MSFAMRIASFSSSNGITVTTGPKISSCATSIAFSTFASTVGVVERALAVGELAAGDDLRAFRDAALDEAVHAVAVRGRDERADLRLGVERVADAQLLRVVGEARDELVVDRRLDEHARARLAALAGGVVDRPHRARDRVVEVRVGEDEVRALAAELERQPLDRVGAEPHDLAARLRRAGERDLVDAGMLDEVRAGRRAVARDDVDRAGGEADLGRELGDPQHAERRLRIGLQHDRAAGGERRRELPRPPSAAGSSTARSARRRRRAPSASSVSSEPPIGIRAAARSSRAPDAKKRKFSTAPPTSALTEEIALPTLRDSSSASSLRFAAIASASACRRRERSFGGVLPHGPSSAARAASTARSTSASPAIATRRERLAGRGLEELAELARRRLDDLAVDEEPVLAVLPRPPWTGK